MLLISFLLLLPASENPKVLAPGNHQQTLKFQDEERTYTIHIPPNYDGSKDLPVILVLHGAGMNSEMMAGFCDISKTADRENFITVFPNGTGYRQIFLTWNAGGVKGWGGVTKANDLQFLNAVLDDLPKRVRVDTKRIYATGMSNGAMMCYRLASELSQRIAAIAPVSGTMAVPKNNAKRPMPILHFHGTKDTLVPYGGPNRSTPARFQFKSVEDTIKTWVKFNQCKETPDTKKIADRFMDGTEVTRYHYADGKNGSEVILYKIEGGGHTWPGEESPTRLIGQSTREISANELIIDFFQKHKLP